jgi:hypothetical protein
MSNPFFKNPKRKTTVEYTPYTPQYVNRGVEPEKISMGSGGVIPQDMSQGRNRQPNFSPSPPFVEAPMENRMYNPIPSSFTESIDDSWESNNEVYDLDGDSFQDVPEPSQTEPDVHFNTEDDFEEPDGDYVVLLNDRLISKGTLEFIEQEVKDLVFGQHKLIPDAVPAEDLTVLKKMKIKVGVFLVD